MTSENKSMGENLWVKNEILLNLVSVSSIESETKGFLFFIFAG